MLLTLIFEPTRGEFSGQTSRVSPALFFGPALAFPVRYFCLTARRFFHIISRRVHRFGARLRKTKSGPESEIFSAPIRSLLYVFSASFFYRGLGENFRLVPLTG